MDFRGWLRDSYTEISQNGAGGVRNALRPVKHKILSGGNVFHDRGLSIYERDWDLLVILDACRYDLMLEVADEYDWIQSPTAERSLDSTTALWMRRNFTDQWREAMAKTTYVCGNPFSESELHEDDFNQLIELWASSWTDPGTVPPEAVTDETISVMREGDPDRVIAHYMQPHCPFLDRPKLSKGKELDRFGNQKWRDVWERLRDGDVTETAVWDGYRANLRQGLDEVEQLLRNVDADQVVVASDHGNAIGEWGVYGHPPNLPLWALRTVPWIETTASDTGERDPDSWLTTNATVSREEQLSALGYVE
jgi:hypothetical protein